MNAESDLSNVPRMSADELKTFLSENSFPENDMQKLRGKSLKCITQKEGLHFSAFILILYSHVYRVQCRWRSIHQP